MTTSPASGPPSDEPPTGGPPAAGRLHDSRATTWMVISGVLALIAIGLGIWAFTTKSDLDDANATIDKQERQLASANATIDKQEQQLASEEQTAQGKEAGLRAVGERERAAFRRVRRRFIREEAEARNLKVTISKEAAELEQARNDASAAVSQDQKDEAALKQARQEARLSTACVKGTVNAMDRFFDASSARAGANGAVRELESIQDQCNQASS